MTDEIERRRRTADETIRSWPGVRPKQVFGYPGYIYIAGKMFAFLAEGGLAVKATGAERDALYARDGVEAFYYGDMRMADWPVLPLHTDEELAEALSAAERARQAVGG